MGNGESMAENSGSKDRSLEALDFIINTLKEHEQNLDKSILDLAAVTQQIGEKEVFNGKMEKFDEKLDILEREVTNLIGYLSNSPKETTPVAVKKQEPIAQAKPTVVEVGSSVILHCKHWVDFQGLAMHAQTLTFNIKEAEKVFQVDALKGKQIIKYTGAFANFPIILKTWLSRQLDITERNILEGFVDKSNQYF
jgi:hypothetical protein